MMVKRKTKNSNKEVSSPSTETMLDNDDIDPPRDQNENRFEELHEEDHSTPDGLYPFL